MFKKGMRRLASGVSIITTRLGEARFGMIATAVSSVSAEPPTLLICVNRTASSHDPIRLSGVYCVNLLSADEDEITERFSSSQMRDSRFADADWREMETGAPALATSLVSFDCRVVQEIEIASHTIFIGEVAAIELWAEQSAPLVYVDGQYVRSMLGAGIKQSLQR
jgi:flavin reductase